jgi:hypothetical protein
MSAVLTDQSNAYLTEQIADELALAPLLGWAHITAPSSITPNCWIFGTHHDARGHAGRNASAPCSRWRRDNSAFELIARCEMMIVCAVGCVAVNCPTRESVRADYADHPTPDDAIRYAMCKAAIAYLTSAP